MAFSMYRVVISSEYVTENVMQFVSALANRGLGTVCFKSS